MSQWFSQVLGEENLDLVIFGNDLEARQVKFIKEASNNARDEDQVIYEDYSPFMLISEASLDDLNRRLPRKLTMRSFRPNFVAKNCDAYAEVVFHLFRIIEELNI